MKIELYQQGEVTVSLDNGDLVIEYKGKGLSNQTNLDFGYVLDKVEEKIPGDWDKPVIAILKAAIKGS